MRLTSTGNLPLSVLIALGAAKTGYDWHKAEKKDKNNVLIRNTAVIGASIAGFTAAQKYADKLIEKRPVKKFINSMITNITQIERPKFVKHVLNTLFDANHNKKIDPNEDVTECAKIIQNCAKDCWLVLSAITSGVIAGDILNLTFFRKSHAATPLQTDFINAPPNYNFKQNPDEGIDKISKVLEADFKPLKGIDQPMAVLDALSISAEKNPDTKMKMTAYELIANALTPTFFISLSMSITKNLRLIQRIPIVGAAAGLGLILGHKLAVQFNRSVTPKISENIKELKEDLVDNFS